MYGDVNIAKPGLVGSFITSVTAADWTAWAALKGMPRDEAMMQYLERMRAIAAE